MEKSSLQKIQFTLDQAFNPDSLKIKDLSYLHKNHEGSKSGKGHYSIYIVSNLFNNISSIQRHKMIYDALGDIIENEIHALTIKAYAKEELEI